MNKMTNSVKKCKVWSIVIGLVLIAAAVICAVFGVNKSASMKDVNTLTVSMNRYVYNTKLDVVEEACEKAFGDVHAKYTMKGDMSGDNCEIVFVFDADADLTTVKENVRNNLNAKMQEGNELEGAFIDVTTGSESVLAASAKGTTLRASIALAVFAVLAFAYTAIRYHIGAGIVVAIVALLGSVLPTELILLVRIPVTNAILYIGAIGAAIGAAFALLTVSKSNSVQGDDAEEIVGNGIPAKEIKAFGICTIAALVIVAVASLIGSGALSTIVWFAIMAILAVVIVCFLGLAYIPALYVPFKKKAMENASKNEYKGAKKTSTKEKKVYEKKAEALVEEAPVEETTEETPVEEPVEETAEETEESTEAEEAPAAEETEPVSETEAE